VKPPENSREMIDFYEIIGFCDAHQFTSWLYLALPTNEALLRARLIMSAEAQLLQNSGS